MQSELLHKQLLETADPETASTWILVLSAANIPHIIKADQGVFSLWIPESSFHKADHEIATYIDENRYWPPKPPHEEKFKPHFQPFSLFLMILLWFFYTITGSWADNSSWFLQGSGDSTAIIQYHEFYRLVTPLTLHADIVHLTGNCVIGLMLLHFLFKTTGNGIGLLATIIAAIAGNGINVLFHGYGHNFVGFSTAIFAAIGIQTMLQVQNLNKAGKSGLYLFLPFMAGTGLLAVLGSSGERTDLGAHFFGMLAGCFVGYTLSFTIIKMRKHVLLQLGCLLVSFTILYLSWYGAFR